MPNHEIFALRYATVEREAHENFLSTDPHDGPMPMDYFIWVIRGGGRTVLLDTGFGEDAARRRNRQLLQHPADALRGFGIAPEDIGDVIVSHLHYDHAGNLDSFPNARFHLQDREMAFATGRAMRHRLMRQPFDVDDVVGMVRLIYEERVCFHDGDTRLHDGMSLHLIPGHANGLQSVRVQTASGNIVLASDASHFYANMETGNPFPVVVDIAATLEGYDRLRALADSPDHVVPGHDPLVRKRYPQVAERDCEAWALHKRS